MNENEFKAVIPIVVTVFVGLMLYGLGIHSGKKQAQIEIQALHKTTKHTNSRNRIK